MSNKHKFNLLLCNHARRELTKEHTQSNTLMPRVPLSNYFHAHYIDKRSMQLKTARVFDTCQRPWRTQTMLTPEQVTQILRLVEELNIDPAPNGKLYPSSRGMMTYLLSTFLGAVMHGYLVEGYDETDESS